MTYLLQAIQRLKPSAEFSFTDDDYATVKWNVLDGKAPTQSEINAEIEQIKIDEITSAAKRDAEQAAKDAARQAVLDKLGLTADEVAALLG